MRTLTLLLFAQLSWAGISNVEVLVGTYSYNPDCLAVDSGPTYAAASFKCIYTDDHGESGPMSGYAMGQTGLGPFGIGISASAIAHGQVGFMSVPSAWASVEWSDTFTVQGATGTGYLYPQIVGTCYRSDLTGFLQFDMLFGQPCLEPDVFPEYPIPVVFGQPYTITMRAYVNCSIFDNLCGGSDYGYLAGMSFTDASGNPITGLRLVSSSGSVDIPQPVPEVSSWVLLGTCGVVAEVLRRTTLMMKAPD